MDKIRSFRQLKIWQKGIDIVKNTYALTKKFPKEEMYGLTAQMRRSAVSIPSNVAEGFKRYHSKEYTQFLHITLGSAAELETQLVIAEALSYIGSDNKLFSEILDDLEHLSKMVSSLLRKLR